MTEVKPAAKTFCQRCNNQRFLIRSQKTVALAYTCPSCSSTCRFCRGQGYRFIAKNGYSYAKPCQCQELHQRIALFNRAQIPARYHSKVFIPLQNNAGYALHRLQEKAFERVHSWSQTYTPGTSGFLLMGPCGTGKTLFLCQTLAYLTLKLAVPCRYVEFSLLLEGLRERVAERREGVSLKTPLRDVTVLAVDELGKVRGTDWELAELDTLITARYQAGKTTLFATNYTGNVKTTYQAGTLASEAETKKGLQTDGASSFQRDTLRSRVGTRIYSRLKESCEFIEIAGKDYRFREKDLS